MAMMNEDHPLVERVVTLLARAVLARDDESAKRIAAAYGQAVVDAAYASWGRKIDAAKVLLTEAERVLDQAEGLSDPVERRRHLRLFELYMRAARTGV
jgi:hypothetical protein